MRTPRRDSGEEGVCILPCISWYGDSDGDDGDVVDGDDVTSSSPLARCGVFCGRIYMDFF